MYNTLTMSKKYAGVLFGVASDEESTEVIFDDLENMLKIFEQDRKYKNIVMGRYVPSKVKHAFIDVIFKNKKFNSISGSFLSLLIKNNRVHLLAEILNHYSVLMRISKGEQLVDIISASSLSEKDQKSIKTALQKSLSKKILLNLNVDPTILGGMIIKYDSNMLDLSLLRRMSLLLDYAGSAKFSINK